jgi:hypothetical protein
MASRRGKSAKPRVSRRGAGLTSAVPYYLSTFDSPLSAEALNDVGKFQRPEGPAFAEGQQTLLRQTAEAERQLPELLEKITTCALASDPLMLFSRLHAFDAMLRGVLPSPAMFGTDALLEFYGGLVTSMPVGQVLTRLGTDDDPQAFYDLHAALRDYALAEHVLGLGGLDRALIEGSANALASAQRQLEFEHRFDRMFGFPAQLRRIFDAIVEPIANQAREQVGFAPSDALIVADAYVTVLAKRMHEALNKFDRVMRVSRCDRTTARQNFADHLARIATSSAALVEDDLPGVLAHQTGIPRDQLMRLVTALSTPLGSQPSLQKIGDTNTLRTRPIIALPEGRYLWARPVDFIQSALGWAGEFFRGNELLSRRYEDSRQRVCEELPRQALAQIFGAYVHANVSYPADGQWPDIDVLTAVPGVAIVVEAKGGVFTEQARRAAPERVKKKAREFVDKALSQNARAVTYLQGDAADLRDKRKRRLTIPPNNHVVSVIVTLDRVDPFATYLPDGGKRDVAPKDGTWLVALADLLLVADVLRNPAEFVVYAQVRAAMNAAGGPRVFTEADALGAWCEYRIGPSRPQPGEIVLLSTSSQSVNDYYTYVSDTGLGVRPPRPTTHVPVDILNSLDGILENHPERWYRLATAVMQLSSKHWLPVEKILQEISAERTAKPSSRRRRKRTRSAASGMRLSPNLTIYFEGLSSAEVAEHDSAALLVRKLQR